MQAWNLVWRFFYMYVFNKDPGQPKIQDGNHSSRWLPQKYEICQVSIKSLISSPYFQIWVTLDVNHCRYVVYIPCRMKGTWDYCLNLSQKWKKWSLASLKSNTNIMPQFSFWKCISKYIFAFPTSKNMLYKRISYIIYGCTNIYLYRGRGGVHWTTQVYWTTPLLELATIWGKWFWCHLVTFSALTEEVFFWA